MEIKNIEFFAEIKLKIEEIQLENLQIFNGKYIDSDQSNHLIAEYMYSMIQDYEDVNTDKRRLVREIDVILCGKDAAIQASLCDLISPIRELKEKYEKAKEAIKKNNMVLTEIYSKLGWQFDLKEQANTEHLIKTNKEILE